MWHIAALCPPQQTGGTGLPRRTGCQDSSGANKLHRINSPAAAPPSCRRNTYATALRLQNLLRTKEDNVIYSLCSRCDDNYVHAQIRFTPGRSYTVWLLAVNKELCVVHILGPNGWCIHRRYYRDPYVHAAGIGKENPGSPVHTCRFYALCMLFSMNIRFHYTSDCVQYLIVKEKHSRVYSETLFHDLNGKHLDVWGGIHKD